ncbi:class I SAM-dependent methyltransferase [Phytohabitans sp. ZYX-F-186]|uniref:Class I SAM-dependent methyltransferase n=1 Tax=Phytohabitans maris TaxID=3071409 RepID=A0ABU0ZX97_9ACTN|nr:class I SAM-dependent methyltransferase [Phytohabitans sp. ZYX-F-186]MDQ7910597.1 class I SAM-dependent methyltransferase [Phytohabitans sp. ZYX-F-186]
MPGPPPPPAEEQARRWSEVLANLAAAIPDGTPSVVVDGRGYTGMVADRLAAALRAAGRPCARLSPDDGRAAGHEIALADGPGWRGRPPAGRWDVVIWLRTPPAGATDRHQDADIVVDLHDPGWPVIRHLTARLARHGRWYITESRAFFATRAHTWDTKFGDDLPAYAAAVSEAGIATGGVVVDVGCGTGRALPALRAATGPGGTVVGVDLTPQMLAVARPRAEAAGATLLLGDAHHLPIAGGAADAVFAAGLITHLADPRVGLAELARITRPGGRLVLFHPSGRIALAARHGHAPRPDDPLAEGPLRAATGRTGWRLRVYDDPPHRFFAVADRQEPGVDT